jgi:hypothetical protein
MLMAAATGAIAGVLADVCGVQIPWHRRRSIPERAIAVADGATSVED